MTLQYCIYTQREHETHAALVVEEQKCLAKQTAADIAAGASYGLLARCNAATHFGQWAITEGLMLVPKMIAIGIELLSSDDVAFTKKFYQKTSAVYWKAIRAAADQALVMAGAVIVPEILYGNLQLHRSLFSVELSDFIASAPSLSRICRNILCDYPQFGDLVCLWNLLGLDRSLWKKELEQAALHLFETKQATGSELLNPESDTFRKLLFSQTSKTLSQELDRACAQGRLTEGLLKKMTPFACNCLFNFLAPATQTAVLNRAPHLKETFESPALDVINITEAYIGCRFLPLHTFQIYQLLFERMKLARDGLLKLELYTADDIEACDDGAYTAIVYLAICYLVDGATLIEDGGIQFTAANGLQIALKNDEQFFGARAWFVELKQLLLQLDKNQTEVLLINLRSGSIEDEDDQRVKECFGLICRCKLEIIDTKVMSLDRLRDQDKTPWGEVFTVKDV